MIPVHPKLHPMRHVEIAKNQKGFKPITVALGVNTNYPVPNKIYNTVVMAFRPSAEELARLNAGEDIYVHLLTHGNPQQGIMLNVGIDEVHSAYGMSGAIE
jgi:hypothetical protein